MSPWQQDQHVSLPVHAATKGVLGDLCTQGVAVATRITPSTIPLPNIYAGVLDLRPAIAAAQEGACLNAKQLDGVASSVDAALRVGDVVLGRTEQLGSSSRTGSGNNSSGGLDAPRFPLLASLAEGISEGERETLAALRTCIRGGLVTDEADASLAATRADRASNLSALRTLVTGLARELASKGAAEGREPMLVRGRFCVAVRSNRRSELPKGSVKLGASSSGATVYMEPAPAVELNNREIELAAREEEQETLVLAGLSALLASRAQQLSSMLQAAAALDLAAARAKHAEWLGAVRPVFACRWERTWSVAAGGGACWQ